MNSWEIWFKYIKAIHLQAADHFNIVSKRACWSSICTNILCKLSSLSYCNV